MGRGRIAEPMRREDTGVGVAKGDRWAWPRKGAWFQTADSGCARWAWPGVNGGVAKARGRGAVAVAQKRGAWPTGGCDQIEPIRREDSRVGVARERCQKGGRGQ